MFLKKETFFKTLVFISLTLVCATAAIGVGVKLPKGCNDRWIDPDELLYVYYAGIFKSVFITHKDTEINRSELRYASMPVGSYIIGLVTYFSPYRSFLAEPVKLWVFASGDGQPDLISDRDVREHPFPYVREMVSVLRERLLIFRATACALFFIIGSFCFSYICAIPSVCFLLGDKIFIAFTSLALYESIWLSQHFFNLLLIFFYFFLWQKKVQRQMPLLVLAVLIGLTAGLLTATKINGVLNLFIFLICFAVILLKQIFHERMPKSLGVIGISYMVIILSVFFITFVAIHPALHIHPLYGIKKIFYARIDCFSNQVQFQPQWHLAGPISRVKYIIKHAGLANVKMVFLMAGILYICSDIRNAFKKKAVLGMAFIMFISFLLYFASIVSFMVIAYYRYIIVLLPYIYLFMVYGVYRCLAPFMQRFSNGFNGI